MVLMMMMMMSLWCMLHPHILCYPTIHSDDNPITGKKNKYIINLTYTTMTLVFTRVIVTYTKQNGQGNMKEHLFSTKTDNGKPGEAEHKMLGEAGGNCSPNYS